MIGYSQLNHPPQIDMPSLLRWPMINSQPSIATAGFFYSVTATLPTQLLRDEYVAWIAGSQGKPGHIHDVVVAGARSGEVVVLEGEPLRVQAVYTFANSEAFAAYLAHHAPRLRAEGLAKFGDSRISFERATGIRVYAEYA